MHYGDTCIIIGALGLMGSSIGPPLLARLLSLRGFRNIGNLPRPDRFGKVGLNVLIPAHNEESLIVPTLQAIAASGDAFDLSITVGLDRCTDLTREKIEKFRANSPTKIHIDEGLKHRGKWGVLYDNIRHSSAEWVALVDAGAIWSPNLIGDATRFFEDPDVAGIAPSYRPEKSGWIECWDWKFEGWLKSTESASGGPIAVHGATVFYRRLLLLNVLRWLEGIKPGAWLNDDVTIPLAMRYLFPRQRLVYLRSEDHHSAYVRDLAHGGDGEIWKPLGTEHRRRNRMVTGNLEWILMIFIPNISKNPLISCIASRRVFRLFWAYWTLLIGVGIGTRIANSPLAFGAIGTAIAGLTTSGILHHRSRHLLVAFVSGLEVPLLCKRLLEGKRILWS